MFFRKKQRNFVTSITDFGNYAELCHLASWDNKAFSSFRTSKAYTPVLEHVSYEQGKGYLDEIPETKYFDEFRKNDLYGAPAVCDYGEHGFFSPTTLRYIKVFYDIQKLFGDLSDFTICEIGVGYGGQCRIFCSAANIKKYTLIDIPQALLLTKRYLLGYPIRAQISFKTLNECSADEKFDLVISNYAFTEINREIQEVYMEKIISKAKRGYITYNEISPPEFKSFRKAELLSMIPTSQEFPEKPKTHEKNCIIAWGM